jgi:hypothetical protein
MEQIQNVIKFVQNHMVEIGIVYLFILNTLKGLHDALEAIGIEKKDNNSMLDKIIFVMGKMTSYLIAGKRA